MGDLKVNSEVKGVEQMHQICALKCKKKELQSTQNNNKHFSWRWNERRKVHKIFEIIFSAFEVSSFLSSTCKHQQFKCTLKLTHERSKSRNFLLRKQNKVLYSFFSSCELSWSNLPAKGNSQQETRNFLKIIPFCVCWACKVLMKKLASCCSSTYEQSMRGNKELICIISLH